MSNKIQVTFNGYMHTATLSDNRSAEAFLQLLRDNGGSVTISCHDYGKFEKVGDLPRSLPTSDEQITTKPGDIILYLGSEITLYYAQNTWNFTLLGHLDGDVSNLKSKLGNGNVEITYSLIG